jgi:nucleoside-diphosphate-sugar epimerase
MASERLFCFGYGYSAAAFARACRALGWRVAGTCRDADKRNALAADGIEAFQFARGRSLPAGALDDATHVLVSIPPDETGDPACDLHARDLMALPQLRWLGYLSTTGVYGDHQGAWVDEASALRATEVRARRRIAAEEQWLALWREARLPVHVFRLSGIYGPGRSALDSVRAGRAQRIVKPGQVFSRIHVADIARVLACSVARPVPGAIYNLADDEPSGSDAVITEASALLGVPPPPEVRFEDAALSPMAASFYRDNRRVSNARIKGELGVTLLYPSYREGLRAILAAERG